MRRVFVRAAVMCLAAAALARPTIERGGIRNAASLVPYGLPGGYLAPGCRFVVRGQQLGPDSEVKAPSSLRDIDLAGVSVLVAAGPRQWNALPITVTSTEILALLPSTVPAGNISVLVTYRGETSRPATALVAPSSFGIFTMAKRVEPGQLVTIFGTGLGAAANPKVDIFVGDKQVRATYIARSTYCGLDQIDFEIPKDSALGCHVPVQVVVSGAPSNVVTLTVAKDPLVCEQADQLAYALPMGGRGGFVMPMRISMRYRPVPSEEGIEFTADLLTAGFQNSQDRAGMATFFQIPPEGSCTVVSATDNVVELLSRVKNEMLAPETRLDAGRLLVRVDGRSQFVDPPTQQGHIYHGLVGGWLPSSQDADAPLFFRPGMLHVGGLGGRGVSPFNIQLPFPIPVTWLNRGRIDTVDRGQDLVLSWRALERSQWLGIAGINIDRPTRSATAFFCRANPTEGRFRVPARILQTLPPSRTDPGQSEGYVFLGTMPMQADYLHAAGGLDAFFAGAVSLDGRSVRFR